MEILDIIFLIITVGIGYILYSILGKRTGHQPMEPMSFRPAWKKAPVDANVITVPEDLMDAPLITGVKQLKQADPKFDQMTFLSTVRSSFEAIINGFVKGDLDFLKKSLKTDLYHTYAQAIDARNKERQHAELTFFRFIRGTIKDVQLKDSLASVHVNFVSQQSQVLKDAQGKILEGDLDMLDEINEMWVFERDMKSAGSNWVLAETYAA